MGIKGTPYYYHAVLKRISPQAAPPFEDEDMQERVWGRRWGTYNDVGRLRLVLLHRPGDELKIYSEDKYDPSIEALIDDEEQWYFRSDTAPNILKMQEEHDGLARALVENDVVIEHVDCSPQDPNAMMVRDAAIAVKGGAVICRMAMVGKKHGSGRRIEERYVTKKLVELGMPIIRTIHGQGLFEGGSFCFLDEQHAVIGLGYRQNQEGADQIRNVMLHQGVEVIDVPLVGHSLHIDKAIVMVDHDKALVNVALLPFWFLDRLKELGIQAIDVDPRDSEMANNCLAVAPGRILMCEGSDWTADRLCEMGMEVTLIPYDECHKNGGGIHCSTLPLIRDRD